MNKLLSRINSRYLSFLLKQNRRLMGFMLFAFFVIMPFAAFLTIYNNRLSFEGALNNSVTPMLSLSLVVYIMATLIIPGLLLGYLMDKSKMDTYQTLPIRKQDLFFNKYILIICVLFIPYAINWIFSLLVYTFYGGISIDYLQNLIDLLIILAFTPLLIGVPIFSHLNTGRLADSIMYGVFLHLSQFLAYIALPLLFNEKLFGLRDSITGFWQSLISYDISLFNLVFDNKFYVSTIIWILLGFVLYFINQYFYAKRPVQDIGKPVLNNWFFPVVSTYLISIFFGLLLLSFMDSTNYINGVVLPFLITLVIYLGLDVINNRGFKYSLKAASIFTLIAIIVTITTYSVVRTGLFGLTRQIPKTDHYTHITVYSTVEFEDSQLLSSQERKEFYTLSGVDYGESSIYSHTITSQEERIAFEHNHKRLLDAYYALGDDVLNRSFYSINDSDEYNKQFPDYQRQLNYWNGGNFYFLYIDNDDVVMKRNYFLDQSFYDYLFAKK